MRFRTVFAEKGTLGHADHHHACLPLRYAAKVKLIHIALGIDAHAFEGLLEDLKALGQHLLLQRHHIRRIVQRTVIDRNDL